MRILAETYSAAGVTPMTFKIERLVGRESEIVLGVRGGMQIECVNTLKEMIKPENTKIVLDLSDVMLADRDAAMFLVVCELSSSGIAAADAERDIRGFALKFYTDERSRQ
jgi:hypothetical protein